MTQLKLAPLSLKAERLHTKDSPHSLFVKVQKEFENAFLLESAIGAKRLAEYSFIGFGPQTMVRVKDGAFQTSSSVGGKEVVKTEEPLQELRRILEGHRPGALLERSPFRFVL